MSEVDEDKLFYIKQMCWLPMQNLLLCLFYVLASLLPACFKSSQVTFIYIALLTIQIAYLPTSEWAQTYDGLQKLVPGGVVVSQPMSCPASTRWVCWTGNYDTSLSSGTKQSTGKHTYKTGFKT